MRLKAIWAACGFGALICGFSPWAKGEYVQGEINGWAAATGMDTNRAFPGDLLYSATLTSATTRAASQYQFTQHSTWDPQWGTGSSSTNAAVNSTIGMAHGDHGGGSPGNLAFAETSGMKYTFRLQGDSSWWYRPYTIQSTTNFPAGITNVSDNSAGAGTNAVTVTAQMGAAPSGERTYVRWTTNGFASSALAPGSLSGATATFAIPGQPSGRTVKYYVLTSTMPAAAISNNYDLCTLRANVSGGTNYSYLVGETEPVLANCWHYPTNAEPAGATMRNPTNPTPSSATYVYVGNYYEAGVGGADMTGGWVFYRRSTDGGWSSNALTFDSSAGNNHYWIGTIPSNAVGLGETLQYYLRADYANGGADTTYLGTTNQTGMAKYAQATNAAAHPFEAVAAAAEPVLANCWHYPTNAEPAGATMRNPTNPTPSGSTYVYVGNYYEAGVGGADMTGGWVFYRKSTEGAWTSNALAFDSTAGNNHYWIGAIPSNAVGLGETLQYYLRADYANGGADTTYLGTTNQTGMAKYAQATNAAAHPFAAVAAAHLGNCWHSPANAEPAGAYMRNPRHPYASNTVTIYSGNQYAGEGNAGDQTGGTIHYRLQGMGVWSSTGMVYDSASGNNKYWRGAIPAGTFSKTQAVEYVLEVSYADHDATYLGRAESGTTSQPFSGLAAAQAEPFAYTYGGDPGTEPGYVWHGGNLVKLSSTQVQIWAKIGYEKDGNRWADQAEVRYRISTTNGSRLVRQGIARRTGSKLGPGDLARTNAMAYSHGEDDPSENGNAMWWVATIEDAELAHPNATLEYQVAAWKSTAGGGNGVERLAEWQADGANDAVYEYRMHGAGAGALTVNGQNADYTTTKFFVDEARGETAPLEVRYSPPAGALNVEVFSNVDRRDLVDGDWNGDGVPDGIKPPDGNLVTTNDAGAYFAAFPMVWDGAGGTYLWATNARKCGAYRLTARYQTEEQAGSTNWSWYSSDGRRDHAIVVSPKKALQQTMYELNALTIKATANSEAGRSTFDDLIDPLVSTNVDRLDEFSIEYLNKIQANCLWFQPIHPSGIDRSENDPATGSRYNPGSPYATRDYFSVNSLFSRMGTEEAAMQEFAAFVGHCDQATNRLGSTNWIGTINVMLDGVFNHTSWDAEFGEMGVELGYCTNKDDRIGWFKPGWYARVSDYGEPATYYNTAWDNDVATAPDRGDFGKWADAAELYYGKYSCLVRHNPDNNSDYLNEEDVFDFTGMSPDTVDLWKYVGRYTEYWLDKTGHALTNRPGEVDANGIALDDYGIDGLRCDFGQGLPPQLWEYIINRTRSMKWNFMFMAETLDGGVPGYRSNRHFDILNENMVFQFTQAHVSTPWELRTQIENRRTAYNGGAILLNLTGHDEIMPWADPWVTASRYAMVSAVMGVPMVFYGQEQGIGPYAGTADKYTGFADFELNFGKWIPHFKRWNQLRVWNEPPLDEGSRYMAQWHGRVNWARLNSPALRSPNQYFLDRMEGGDNSKIFAVAKYEDAGAVADGKDAVLAFALFVNAGDHSGASDTYDLRGCWDMLGLSNSATAWYNVRNLAATVAESELWATPRTGADIHDNGIWVSFDSDGSGRQIHEDGAIVQYLKIEPAEEPGVAGLLIEFSPEGPIMAAYMEPVQFSVGVFGTNGLPVAGATTSLVTQLHGATLANGLFSWMATNPAWVGATNGIQFEAAGNTQTTSAWMQVVVPSDSNGNGIPDVWERAYFADYTNAAGGNYDEDPFGNYDEYLANTDPTDESSFLAVTGVRTVQTPAGHEVVFLSQSGRVYRIEFADEGMDQAPAPSWMAFQSNGAWTNETGTATHAFIDDGTEQSSGIPLAGRRFYRVKAGLR